ncbi:unnamed protein product [Haemonchus placei]|uniref:AATF-Che1 domain-containing protein n=1 Tax=Haemonchus placei TaxID=6290 RepID=A0A0N4WLH1_HAEPC|nr:unnamed protein product [Haemonchus placei]
MSLRTNIFKVSRSDIFDEFSDMAGLGDRLEENGGEPSNGGEEDGSITELNGNFTAESVAAQTQTWEQLLYVKIKLQAALRAFNQLPRGQLAKDLLKEADEETKANVKLGRLHMTKGSCVTCSGAVDSDDEEIESNDEDEEEEEEEVQQATSMSMKSLSKRICKSEEQFGKFRDSTLIKWEGRTRLVASRRPKNASTDFSAFEKENVVSQIEKVKFFVHFLGLYPLSATRFLAKRADEDEEIYDDDDFYQVLLKELIDKKSSNTQDPVAMTRFFLNAIRKVYFAICFLWTLSRCLSYRYIPIPKLVNFHPAMPEMVEWNHETRNELFKSLFS